MHNKEINNKSLSPIFIIGAPRSGTTIVYQYLAAVFEVVYINNLWAMMPNIYPLKKSWLKKNAPYETNNYYGNSLSLFGTQEGGSIFRRWFSEGDTDHCESLSHKNIKDMRNYFGKVSNKANKPILIKNGRNSVRLIALMKIFPNARYIFIERNPLDVAQSIVNGRIQLMSDKNQNWTVKPKEWKSIETLPYPEQVASQVFFINKHIQTAKELIPAEAKIIIEYSEFCVHPFKVISRISEKWNDLIIRNNLPEYIVEASYTASSKKSLPCDVLKRISDELDKLEYNEMNQ